MFYIFIIHKYFTHYFLNMSQNKKFVVHAITEKMIPLSPILFLASNLVYDLVSSRTFGSLLTCLVIGFSQFRSLDFCSLQTFSRTWVLAVPWSSVFVLTSNLLYNTFSRDSMGPAFFSLVASSVT